MRFRLCLVEEYEVVHRLECTAYFRKQSFDFFLVKVMAHTDTCCGQYNGALKQATDEEQSAAAAKFDQAISRPLPELLAYSDVTTALGESEAKTAPPTVQEAWGISSRNPYITHDQRVEIAGFVDAHMRELERSSSNAEGEVSMLEFALTPPDDFRGNY